MGSVAAGSSPSLLSCGREGRGTHEEDSKYVFSRDSIEWRAWRISRSGFFLSVLLAMAVLLNGGFSIAALCARGD